MPGRPIIDDERQRIIDTLRETGNVAETARRTSRGKATISRIARDEGIAVDRSTTKEATAARKADVEAEMVALRAQAVAEARHLLTEMRSPAVLHHWYQGEHFEHEIDAPTTGDKKNLAIAFGISVDKAIDLGRETASDDGARGLLEDLVDGLRSLKR